MHPPIVGNVFPPSLYLFHPRCPCPGPCCRPCHRCCCRATPILATAADAAIPRCRRRVAPALAAVVVHHVHPHPSPRALVRLCPLALALAPSCPHPALCLCKSAKNPSRVAKIFFGSRFGDFVLIPTCEVESPQMCHLRTRDKVLHPPPALLLYFCDTADTLVRSPPPRCPLPTTPNSPRVIHPLLDCTC